MIFPGILEGYRHGKYQQSLATTFTFWSWVRLDWTSLRSWAEKKRSIAAAGGRCCDVTGDSRWSHATDFFLGRVLSVESLFEIGRDFFSETVWKGWGKNCGATRETVFWGLLVGSFISCYGHKSINCGCLISNWRSILVCQVFRISHVFSIAVVFLFVNEYGFWISKYSKETWHGSYRDVWSSHLCPTCGCKTVENQRWNMISYQKCRDELNSCIKYESI